jgi:hypothetical protein
MSLAHKIVNFGGKIGSNWWGFSMSETIDKQGHFSLPVRFIDAMTQHDALQ